MITAAKKMSDDNRITVGRIQEMIGQQWPEAVYLGESNKAETFPVLTPALQSLFPNLVIPAGQLLEVTGGISSGKTSVLLQLLVGISQRTRILYVDFSKSFFPLSALSAGIAMDKMILVQPESLIAGIRTAELLLQQNKVRCVVFDLVGRSEKMPQILLHRLRQLTVKSRAVTLFLTDESSHALPASLISLQLTVSRGAKEAIEIITTKSRLTHEGARVELSVC